MQANPQANRSRLAGPSDFAPGTALPNQSLPLANPEEEPSGRRVAALRQPTNTTPLRRLAKGVGMSAAAALALALILLWPGVASARLSCANGQPPVAGLSGVPSCPDANTTAEMVDGSVYR